MLCVKYKKSFNERDPHHCWCFHSHRLAAAAAAAGTAVAVGAAAVAAGADRMGQVTAVENRECPAAEATSPAAALTTLADFHSTVLTAAGKAWAAAAASGNQLPGVEWVADTASD